jgi:hypothetical protein
MEVEMEMEMKVLDLVKVERIIENMLMLQRII